MGFYLKIEGAENIELDDHIIETVKFHTDTPDDSDARSTDVVNTITVNGKILAAVDGEAADQTMKLAKWSLVRAEVSDSYRRLTIEVHTASQIIRKFSFPNAFVVDYYEHFGDSQGVGGFELIMRQKKDKFESTTIEGGYGF